ncbi:serine/threonine-protein kinase [Archangium primigenium]|uniref:serine/threonine-protein kinase n=1 Tax=[Archangium] primigenium TaxID=2792470 RepID=UPI0019577A98|nr:serine/threonine-protein kinase [Archangium primigenium]MBM7113343.1 serine/threonine protein kinase [Archangium primigenium]
MPVSHSVGLLQEYLAQDVVPREMTIARFMRGMMVLGCVAALFLGGAIGWKLALSLSGLTAVLAIYYTLMLRALGRGGFHPAMQWVDSALTVSIPAVVFLTDVHFHGAVYALTTPPAYAWGTLIVVCALRAGRGLAYFAAGLAAVEYLLLYFLVAVPRLPPDTLDTLSPAMVFLRAVFLFSYGPLAATLATLIVTKAGDALRAIREKDVMGKYFLQERLGVGGMAEVFRATYSPEGGFEKQVALKRVLPAFADNEEFLSLFKREAELGSLLIHPNIVQVLDLGRHQGTVFLTLEFVDGMPLSTLLKRVALRRLTPAAAAFIGAEMAAALAYMHDRSSAKGEPLGLVHRDLNPPNILLSRIGEVKLSDFGIARAANQVGVTQLQQVRGKAGYMAPEQAYGLALDGRVDLFALGLTLHEALTGQRALQGDTDAELMLASTRQEILPPSHFVPGISPTLDAIVMGLLRHDREQRTPTAEVLRQQLLTLTGYESPYIHGRKQLIQALREARTQASAPVRPLLLTPDMALTEGAAQPALPVPERS